MKNEMTLGITEIQRFCMHDGPGVRTVVFLKGCPLRCAWCHNPETQSPRQELLYYTQKCIGCGACAAVCPTGAHTMREGMHLFDRSKCISCAKCAEVCPSGALETARKDMTLEQILDVIEKDRAFYKQSGGVTVSGGEPMMQPEGTLALLRACRERGIGTAIESCGCFDARHIPALAELVDLLLWDFKDGNDARHKEYTGASHRQSVKNLMALDALGVPSVLRCIMVKGVNMQPDHYDAIATLWKDLKNCQCVELLPYHAYGGSKMLPLGLADNGRREWIPQDEDLARAKEYLKEKGVRLK